jgi:hypothetical protein
LSTAPTLKEDPNLWANSDLAEKLSLWAKDLSTMVDLIEGITP